MHIYPKGKRVVWPSSQKNVTKDVMLSSLFRERISPYEVLLEENFFMSDEMLPPLLSRSNASEKKADPKSTAI